MMGSVLRWGLAGLKRWGLHLAGAVVFYTCVPLPSHWPFNFKGIARYAPLLGILMGLILGGGDWVLMHLGLPIATRSALVVALWVGLTGGLHLDGAMDTADGLAVMEPERRLAVMADSRSGAFGVMAAIAIVGLKVLALSELTQGRGFALMAVAGWGRWGQVVAIARYPYLKPEGKGAFHQAHARPGVDWLWGGMGLMALGLAMVTLGNLGWVVTGGTVLGGMGLALGTGSWFHRQLGGHTGDTYGAVVEWTEALLLCLITALV